MGVPRLRHHLQPYADPATLTSGTAVVDGPALAYHIHSLCRSGSVKVPSCEALSRVCLGWLDEVTSHGLSIGAIYFDGYLPAEKLPVRKDRLLRRTADLGSVYRSSPSGCDRSLVTSSAADCSLCHTLLPRKQHHMLPPNPFTVQAIIDTLKLSPRYGCITHIIPGEADPFCAEMARSTPGAVIFTGDSDLLVYSIEDSSVVFLDDIRLPGCNLPPSCFKFSPSSLEARLGLHDTNFTNGVRRLAFELTKTPHASLLQLLSACKHPAEEGGYGKFDRGYDAQQSIASLPLESPASRLLDARLLELALQLDSCISPPSSDFYPPFTDIWRIFLPNLIEHYGRSSSFDTSTEVRRIAYSLLAPAPQGKVQVVQEFKRLYVPDGGGTSVPLCLFSELPNITRELAACLLRITSQTGENNDYFWPTIALVLDALHSKLKGKAPAIFSLADVPTGVSDMGQLIPWDIVHFRAQVHACCYSFRILGQALSLARMRVPAGPLDVICGLMEPYLSRVPPLAELPTTEHILAFLNPSSCDPPITSVLRVLEEQGFVQRPPPSTAERPRIASQDKRRDTKSVRGFNSRNSFGVLLDVED